MKQIVKSMMVALMMIATCTVAFAQPQGKKQRMSREQLAEVQAHHIAEQLAFSDDVTAKFVSVFCQQQQEIWALAPRLGRMAATTDEEQIQQRFDRSEKILAIRKKYYKEYSQFLTQAQIKRVYEIERQTMKRFAKKAKRQAQKRQNR
ncbi:MAG: hypothetical protein MR602_05975 [Bacteroidales bacterium]|nr:hypothetical protein [Bacteroidales bacterium]MDD7094306.1 hypothetical protein [Bacteroidales bacterium]MDY5281456.1 hypothetical protein [Sodaliphilus sp.]